MGLYDKTKTLLVHFLEFGILVDILNISWGKAVNQSTCDQAISLDVCYVSRILDLPITGSIPCKRTGGGGGFLKVDPGMC